MSDDKERDELRIPGGVKYYDAVVVGSCVSTAFCGALLAKAGQRVLLVTNDRNPADLDLHVEPLFDPAASVFAGFESPYLLGQTFDELGLRDAIEAIPQPEIVQVLHPHFRLLLHRDRDVTKADLKREFHGTELGGLSQYFDTLYGTPEGAPGFSSDVLADSQVQGGVRSQWRQYFSKVIPQFGKRQSPESFKNIAEGPLKPIEALSSPCLAFGSYAVPKNLNVEQCLRFLSLYLQGQWLLRARKGGTLQELLHKFIRDHGGIIKDGAVVDSLVVENDKLRGVLLSSFEGVVYGGAIVIGSNHLRLYQGLPDHIRDKNLTYELSRVEPTHWRYTIAVKVNKDALPEGMAQNVAYVGFEDLPLEEENYLSVRIVPEEVDPQHVSGTVLMMLTALVPLKAAYLDPSYLRRLSGRMLRQLESFVPFIEFNIVSMNPDFRKSPQSIVEMYPYREINEVPEPLLQYYVRGGKEVQAFSSVSWSTPHQNLYFCGRVLWPSLGNYGEVLAARKVFEDIARYRRST